MLIAHLDTRKHLAHYVLMTQSRTYPIPREADLTPEARAVLQQIGIALDEQRPLRVYENGIVALDQADRSNRLAKERANVRKGTRRSATQSRKGATRRKGAPSRPRHTDSAPRLSRNHLRAAYEDQVKSLAEDYPTLQTFADDDGMWLLAKSSILSGFAREATFLIALPYNPELSPVAWGFWSANEQHIWIGPRHTNFQDGSICAFSPDEGAWSDAGDLKVLLGLYSAWALRHLHLEIFGRWPGKQYSLIGADPRVQAYYRIRECQDDELCGCGSEARRYAECCKPFDQQYKETELMILFSRLVPGGFLSRLPPPAIVSYIEGCSPLPCIADVHMRLASAAP